MTWPEALFASTTVIVSGFAVIALAARDRGGKR